MASLAEVARARRHGILRPPRWAWRVRPAAPAFAHPVEHVGQFLDDVRVLVGDVPGFADVLGQVVELGVAACAFPALPVLARSASRTPRDEFPLTLSDRQRVAMLDQ